MHTTNHSNERKTKKQSLFKAAESWGAETAVFATLGFAALVAIVVAAVSGSVPAKLETQLTAAAGKSPVVKYLDSGQLVADARTLAAIAHYIMEAERPMVTNASESRLTEKSVAMPTNNVTSAPKA